MVNCFLYTVSVMQGIHELAIVASTKHGLCYQGYVRSRINCLSYLRANLRGHTEAAVTVLGGSEFHAAIMLGRRSVGTAWVKWVCSRISV